MIDLQYNETISTKRLVKEVDGYKQTYETHLASIPCCVQPLEADITQDLEGSFGKNSLMFCATADIIEGDRIVRTIDEVEVEYRVVSIEKYDFLHQSHMEVVIRIFES